MVFLVKKLVNEEKDVKKGSWDSTNLSKIF